MDVLSSVVDVEMVVAQEANEDIVELSCYLHCEARRGSDRGHHRTLSPRSPLAHSLREN